MVSVRIVFRRLLLSLSLSLSLSTIVIVNFISGDEDDGLLLAEVGVSSWTKQDVLLLEENNKYGS